MKICQLFECLRSNKEQIFLRIFVYLLPIHSPKHFKNMINLFEICIELTSNIIEDVATMHADEISDIHWYFKYFEEQAIFGGKNISMFTLTDLSFWEAIFIHRALMWPSDEVPSHKEVPPNIWNYRQNHRVIVTILEKPYAQTFCILNN